MEVEGRHDESGTPVDEEALGVLEWRVTWCVVHLVVRLIRTEYASPSSYAAGSSCVVRL